MSLLDTDIREMNSREMIVSIISTHRDRVFLVDALNGEELTYGEFHRQACALAAELRARGIGKGDRVGVMMPNCCELAVLYFACIYLGAVIVPLNPSLSKNDAQYILATCKPVLLVTNMSEPRADLYHKVIFLAIGREAHKTETQTTEDQSNDSAPIHIARLSEAKNFIPLESATAEDLVVIMYTSGTSAKPKGLAHKLQSMFRNATVFAGVQGIDRDSRFYLTLSMAYMGGFYNLLILPFLCGASVVVDHVFDARSSLHFWEKARNRKANTLWMAPTVLSILLRMDRGRTGEEFCRNSVRHAFVGFAPLSLKVKEEFESRYGVPLIENYGLSETLFVTARSNKHIGESGYVGEALPGVQLRIVNNEGTPAASSVDGEVQISTPDIMAGYLDAEGQLVKSASSEWFPTGDMGHLTNEGALLITGRKKDIIIRGGVNVSPAAIEEVMMQVHSVLDAAVVSIPHELYGEDIVAVLKLEPGVELDSVLDSVVAHAKQNLAQHQQPARYLAIDDLPRTANGKVQKARIRELVAEKLQISTVSPLRKSA